MGNIFRRARLPGVEDGCRAVDSSGRLLRDGSHARDNGMRAARHTRHGWALEFLAGGGILPWIRSSPWPASPERQSMEVSPPSNSRSPLHRFASALVVNRSLGGNQLWWLRMWLRRWRRRRDWLTGSWEKATGR